MIKNILTLGIFLASIFVMAQETANYIVIINNDSIKVNLDNEYKFKTASGEELAIKIVQPNVLTYTDDMVSFKYDKSLNVSNTEIEKGISQCMVMRSTGNGFMVQKFNSINPSTLTQLMLNEIIKESISYGYTKEEKVFKKKLLSGQTIEGIQATLTYKGEKEVYTVASYGEKDEGVIVITMMLNEDFNDKQIIDLFLDTLTIEESK